MKGGLTWQVQLKDIFDRDIGDQKFVNSQGNCLQILQSFYGDK